MSALQFGAGREPDSVGRERVDRVGDDVGLAAAQRVEQIAVGDDAQTLIPRVVLRVEVLQIGVVTEMLASAGQHQLAHPGGTALGEAEHRALDEDVPSAGKPIVQLVRKHPAHRERDLVDGRQRDDVRGRALQHRHVRRVVGHCRHQRDRGRAAADHHDALVAVVEIVRPVLRMDERAGEIVLARQLGTVALVVVVVPGAHDEEVTRPRLGRAAAFVDCGNGPSAVVARPAGVGRLAAEGDVLGHAVLGRGRVDVVADRRPVREHLGIEPRPEVEAEGVHVRVRPHARVPEQIPGTADVLPALEDRVAALREVPSQVARSPDTRDARAENQNVDMPLHRHRLTVTQCHTRTVDGSAKLCLEALPYPSPGRRLVLPLLGTNGQ